MSGGDRISFPLWQSIQRILVHLCPLGIPLIPFTVPLEYGKTFVSFQFIFLLYIFSLLYENCIRPVSPSVRRSWVNITQSTVTSLSFPEGRESRTQSSAIHIGRDQTCPALTPPVSYNVPQMVTSYLNWFCLSPVHAASLRVSIVTGDWGTTSDHHAYSVDVSYVCGTDREACQTCHFFFSAAKRLARAWNSSSGEVSGGGLGFPPPFVSSAEPRLVPSSAGNSSVASAFRSASDSSWSKHFETKKDIITGFSHLFIRVCILWWGWGPWNPIRLGDFRWIWCWSDNRGVLRAPHSSMH